VLGVALTMMLSACGDSELAIAIKTFAREQGVERSAVKEALALEAHTDEEQLAVVRAWQADVPKTPLPNLDGVLARHTDLIELAKEQLKTAACSAVSDVISTGQAPNAEKFLENYVYGVLTADVPGAELQDIANTFEELYQQAVAGNLTYVQLRFELLKFQYC
jgi:hypothetical protein